MEHSAGCLTKAKPFIFNGRDTKKHRICVICADSVLFCVLVRGTSGEGPYKIVLRQLLVGGLLVFAELSKKLLKSGHQQPDAAEAE